MKRRDLLRLLGVVGAGWWPAGCQSQAGPIAGRIVGASFKTGHRLRRGDFPPPDETRTVMVAILGGGVAGLSAAWKLARSGVDDFVVVELEAEMGGNARFARYPASAAPWGAHYLPIPTVESRAVRELLTEMGVMQTAADGSPVYDLEMLCQAPQERLFMYGRWYEGVYPREAAELEDLRQFDAFNQHVEGWKRQRDAQGRKAFTIPVAWSSPQWRDLDRLSMADYMRQHGFTSDRLHWYVNYGCRDDYGSTVESTSAWAGLHYFASRDGGGYHGDPNADLVWPEGNGFLVRHLRQGVGTRVAPQALVFHVEPQDDGVVVDYLVDERVIRLKAHYAICAMPRFVVRYVLPGYAQPWLSSFTYAPWVVANVVLDKPPVDHRNQMPLCWDNVVYDSPSLGYVVATHQSLSLAPGGTVLTWYRSFPEPDAAATRQTLLNRSWDSYRDEVMTELERLHPEIRPHVQQLDVMLWGHGMIRPQTGFMWSDARAASQQPIGRLHFAHSDMSGISIFEEAQYHGVRAAEAILAALHHPFRTSL